jgi:ABC-type Fe3+/spermidine/putrescine transport system ATPase subunit
MNPFGQRTIGVSAMTASRGKSSDAATGTGGLSSLLDRAAVLLYPAFASLRRAGSKEKSLERKCSGTLLVSLGSAKFNADVISRLLCVAAKTCHRFMVCFLDYTEVSNVRVLSGLSREASEDRVSERMLRLTSGLQVPPSLEVSFERLSSYETREPKLREWIDRVSRAYRHDEHFAAACQNQTYVNLQPLLNRIGVRNRRHPLVAQLATYILVEAALKLHLAVDCRIDVEYALGEEMEVMRTIYAGKYHGAGLSPSRSPTFRIADVDGPRRTNLEVDNVSFAYHSFGARREAFSITNCSMRVPAGSTIGVLGVSGSGKSTLLRLIAGHLRPSHGRILLDGSDITGLPPGRRGVMTVFQDNALFPHMTVAENVLYGLRLSKRFSRREMSELTEIYLRRLGISDRRDYRPSQLSGGEMQRVALARALITEPRVLLLDEPTAALDHAQREALAQALVQSLSVPPAPTTIVVSHDRDFLFSLCPLLAVMDAGRLLCVAGRDEVLERPPGVRVARVLGTHGCLNGVLVSPRRFRIGPTAGPPSAEMMVRPSREDLVGRTVFALIRSSRVRLAERHSPCDEVIEGEVVGVRVQVDGALLLVRIDAQEVLPVTLPPSVSDMDRTGFLAGDRVRLHVPFDAVHIVPA